MKDYYSTLNIAKNATTLEIKKAYLRSSGNFHPTGTLMSS